jgi:hypothetical protein
MASVDLSKIPVHLDEFLDGVGALLPDKRQRASFALYTMGLLDDGERKSMEPIAARLSGDPESRPALHQRLLHFGNTNQPIDVMVQTGHLFAPMPDIIRDDMAFIDRLHFYLPGWEIPKMRNDLFADHYGFVVDAEALREMRKHNFTEVARERQIVAVRLI